MQARAALKLLEIGLGLALYLLHDEEVCIYHIHGEYFTYGHSPLTITSVSGSHKVIACLMACVVSVFTPCSTSLNIKILFVEAQSKVEHYLHQCSDKYWIHVCIIAAKRSILTENVHNCVGIANGLF